MTDLTRLANLPELSSVVLGDLSGVFLDSVNEPDGEAVAAIMGFAASTLSEVGALLGVGTLQRIAISGPSTASLVSLEVDSVITASVDSSRSLGAVEKKVDGALRGS